MLPSTVPVLAAALAFAARGVASEPEPREAPPAAERRLAGTG